MSEIPVPHPPYLPREEIESNLTPYPHGLNPGAVRHQFCMSDAVGMKECGYGVHFVRLDPGVESTTIHYHLLESEWIYILRGTAILQHIDSSLQHITSSPTLAPTNAPNTPIPWTTGNPNLDVVETELKSGDFVGWPAGLQSASWAHGLRAGPTGVEYLMGGSREKFDICVYPRLGKAMISDEKFPDGKEFAMAQVPVFPHLYSTDREYKQAQGKGKGR